jgi:hypothetical protein
VWFASGREPLIANVMPRGAAIPFFLPSVRDLAAHCNSASQHLRVLAVVFFGLVRVVDQKTAVVPLHADTLADPDKLVASLRSSLALAAARDGKGPG